MPRLAPTIEPEDLETLKWATRRLEHPSLAARLTAMVGVPVEVLTNLMPRPVHQRARRVADAAILKANYEQLRRAA